MDFEVRTDDEIECLEGAQHDYYNRDTLGGGKMSEDLKDMPGTPQSAEAEAMGEKTFDVGARRRGVALKAAGLKYPMPEDFGGGYMVLRSATANKVTVALDRWERDAKKHPKLKKMMKPGESLTGKAAVEKQRYMALHCLVEWHPDRMPAVGGKAYDVSAMSESELRAFVEAEFLPPLNLLSSAEADDELDMEMLVAIGEGIGFVSDAPASEVGKVGKDYELMPGGQLGAND